MKKLLPLNERYPVEFKTKDAVEDFRSDVLNWTNRYFWDHWWRKKHNVPFGSKKHRSMSFTDMLFEFVEEVEILRYEVEKARTKIHKENEMLGISNDVVRMTQSEIDKDFLDLDIEEFDKKQDIFRLPS